MNESSIKDGFDKIGCLEPLFQDVLKRDGRPPSRKRPGGFKTVLKIIIQQQVSVASAEAIWRRMCRELGVLNLKTILQQDATALRNLGLSRQKASYARSLAEAVASKQLNFQTLWAMEDETVIEKLTQIKGIGRWTAKIYLLSVMQRPDIWPEADIALMEGARDLLQLSARPTIIEMQTLADGWRPYRSYAARLLWMHYNHIKQRETGV